MTAPSDQPQQTATLLQRQPALAAGGITATVSAVMAALWAVAADAGQLTWLTPSSQALVTGAVLAVVALVAGYWAQARSTSTTQPKLVEGTHVQVTDSQGATTGHVQVSVPATPLTPEVEPSP